MWHDEDIEDLPLGRIYDGKMMRRLLPLLAPFRLRVLGTGLLLVATSALGVLPPLLLKRAIDCDIAGHDLRGLMLTAGLYLLLQAVVFATGYLMQLALESLGVRIVSALKQRLFAHMVDLDVSYFDQYPVGKLIARVESDTEAVRRLFTSTMSTMLSSLVSLVWIIAILAGNSARLLLAIAAIVPVIALLTVLYQRRVRPMFAVVRRKYAAIVGYLTEMLQGMRVVQAFSREAEVRDRLRQLNASMLRTQVPSEVLSMGFFSLMDVFEIIGLAVILFVGGGMANRGLLTIGTLVLFLNYLQQFFAPVHAFSDQVSVMQRAFAAAERVFQILDLRPQVTDAPGAKDWPGFDREIEFKNVFFSYAGRAGQDEPEWVLKDISFTVGKGQRIALVGATGGGKTSVINLLLRFYDPQRGAITVDGRNLRDIQIDSLRSKFGLVLQDVFLFPGSVRENLTLGATIPEATLDQAVEILGLQRIMERMPNGLESELAERGANLSQGERQLVSFARALAFDPEILILDEATSSVDPNSERLIQAGIQRLLQGRTAIIIAHRLSTILDADRILVIHKGRIAESGTHQELMAKNSYYAKLYRIQFA
ncbi:MAG TPA: ABC transporter ATP-binding protein [Candidatus Edwardsbacteria bacterium]|nr:ABC transporter ATP-binding protein [Candidatus Edwardsbacteria bacterium]